MVEFSKDWIHWKWFTIETLEKFEWANAISFLGLNLIPILLVLVPLLLLLRWLISWRKKQKLEVALPSDYLKASYLSYLRFIPPLFLLLAVELFLVALARPQLTNEKVEQWSEGIDIMLVLDISESMQIQDFTPNRLEAAKRVAKEFIEGRIQDRIGLVIFSGEAISYAPLTTDYDLLNNLIDDIDFNMIDKGGTAIGSALAVGTNRMRDSEAKSKVLILLSDGENTAGTIDPTTAANLAYAYGIKMYTIGVGKEGKVPFGTDMFGRTRYIEQSLDETALREIAKTGQGEYFRATNDKALEMIFKRIDEYEKAEIKENRFKDTKDFYPIYLLYGIVFLLIWLLLKNTFMSNILVD